MNKSINLTKKYLTLSIFVTIFFASCVTLIGAYDQVTDQGIQKIQTDISTLFVKMEKNVTDSNYTANSYESLKNNFTLIEGEMKSLQIRCNAIPKYSIIQGQLKTVSDNITLLEALSKTSIKKNVILQPADSAITLQFSQMANLQNALKKEKVSTSNKSN